MHPLEDRLYEGSLRSSVVGQCHSSSNFALQSLVRGRILGMLPQPSAEGQWLFPLLAPYLDNVQVDVLCSHRALVEVQPARYEGLDPGDTLVTKLLKGQREQLLSFHRFRTYRIIPARRS